MTLATEFDHVTKQYLRGGRYHAHLALRNEIADALRSLVPGQRHRRRGPLGPVALDDVSFRVDEGESVALIGPNGSGKTTALKLLARVAYPTAGRIRVRGSVGALIEVGSAIHPELSGRENIWLYGQIIGMTRADIRRRFDDIVDFAEIGPVLDSQVKTYSSGMQLRLGFAIASYLEPDVFVVDEALAVGDVAFQSRCVERMGGLVREGRTLIFVSHDLAAVQATCPRGIFLLDGRVAFDGPIRDTVQSYLAWVDATHQARLADGEDHTTRGVSLEAVRCAAADGQERYVFRTGEDVAVTMRFRINTPVVAPRVTLGISDGRTGSLVLSILEPGTGAPEKLTGNPTLSCTFRSLPLMPRTYELWCSVESDLDRSAFFEWQPIGAFRIGESEAVKARARVGAGTDGPVFVRQDWRVEHNSS